MLFANLLSSAACAVDSGTMIPNHRCPRVVSTPPLTFSLHSPQLQLCCCVGQVLFYLEQLVLLNFAFPLQLVHLHNEITGTKVFIFLLAQKVGCTGQ